MPHACVYVYVSLSLSRALTSSTLYIITIAITSGSLTLAQVGKVNVLLRQVHVCMYMCVYVCLSALLAHTNPPTHTLSLSLPLLLLLRQLLGSQLSALQRQAEANIAGYVCVCAYTYSVLPIWCLSFSYTLTLTPY